MKLPLNVIKNGSQLLPMITFFYLWISNGLFTLLILFLFSFISYSIYTASNEHFTRILREKKITTLEDASKIMFGSKGLIVLGTATFVLEIVSIICLLTFLAETLAPYLLLLNIGALIYQISLGLFNKDILIKYSLKLTRKIRSKF